MKSFFRFLLIAAFAIIAVACAKDIVDLTGDITGVVKDDADGHLIENCQVALGTTGRSVITNADGQFAFEGVEPGDYQLSFKRTGYNDVTKNVTVVNGQTARADVMMKQKSAFSLSLNELDFGDLSTSNSIIISNNSSEIIAFEVSGVPAWAQANLTKGSLATGASETIVFTVNRDAVDYGTHSALVTFKHNKGSETLKLLMKKVKLSAPEVTIASAATEVSKNSFHIGGTITATGGAEVTAYGHCWSREANPTVNDHHTSLGATVEKQDFTSIVGDLSVATTYHIRAYATNALGTSYSQEITVTTQDVASNKWDGTVAKDFARGKGTITNPYQITTGAELMHIKDVNTNDMYFVMMNDIDLDNRNWLPLPKFEGNFDGNGCTIHNLKIHRTGDDIGLFSILNGCVKNLTIKGVDIDASDSNHVGVLAGSSYVSHFQVYKIENIHVVLIEKSKVIGNDEVGGLIGYKRCYYTDEISNCSIESVTDSYAFSGQNHVGGIIGEVELCDVQFKNCSITASLAGRYAIGGIVGYFRPQNYTSYCTFENCVYKGKLTGSGLGGLVGYDLGSTASGCKIEANMEGTDCSYFGGSSSRSIAPVASYFCGTMAGNPRSFYGKSCYICLKNSDGTISAFAFDDSGHKSKDGENITTYLMESYSQYADYWNFNNTWTFEGKIDGKNVKVSCPRLAWE